LEGRIIARLRWREVEPLQLVVHQPIDELGIAPTVFYRWQKELFENGHALFENGRHAKAVEDAKDEKIQKLEAKLARKNEVMAELMEAHTQLKKDLGEL
jgi:transposase